MFNDLRFLLSANQAQHPARGLPAANEPWNSTMQRHPLSSKLARFRAELPNLTPPNDPLVRSIFEARCEISSFRCASPIRFHSSPKGICLALTGMSGWKNHSPALDYLVLDKPQDSNPHTDFSNARFIEPGLSNTAFHAAIDDARHLIFIGDDKRVKSYKWGTAEGPIAVLPNGTVVRTDKGSASVWKIDELSTHDEEDIIGDEIEVDGYTWRDDPEHIERSSGSTPTSRIIYRGIAPFEPTQWKSLVSAPSTFICAEFERTEEDGTFTCVTLDLETGQMTTMYSGHQNDITAISVSEPEPQLFLTACYDGKARLFDIRQQNPVLSLNAGRESDYFESAALAHPDGIPFIFTGTRKGEAIKTWDVRAREYVYELSTGNNGVQSLAWDARNSTLYAATQCLYIDRMGTSRGYREANIPPGQAHGPKNFRCWPRAARHKEDYFGYMFDAGDHRIFRYTFKETPNADVLPEYGNATLDQAPSSGREAMEALIHNLYINNVDPSSSTFTAGSFYAATNTYSL